MVDFASLGVFAVLQTPFWLIRAVPPSVRNSRRQLIRRFSAACVLAEELEGRLARGEEIEVERHALLCSTLTRLAQRIGIDRRAKNITPSLGDYLRSPPPTEIEEAAE